MTINGLPAIAFVPIDLRLAGLRESVPFWAIAAEPQRGGATRSREQARLDALPYPHLFNFMSDKSRARLKPSPARQSRLLGQNGVDTAHFVAGA